MASDDQVIVLVGGRPPGIERPDGRREISPLWLLAPVLGVFLAIIGFVITPHEESPTTADPAGLDEPSEPPVAVDPTTTRPATEPPELALGWREARLLGAGWTVSSVDHGDDGWLAVSSSPLVVAHVSQNAVVWEAHTVHDLVVEAPVAAVGDGVMAVFGSDQYSDHGRPRPVGAISTDGGSTWRPVEHDGPIVISDIEIAGDRVFVAGSVGDVFGFGWEDQGRAAVWEVVDGKMEAVDTEGGAQSAVGSLATVGGKVMGFGHTYIGAAMWVVGRSAASVVPAMGAGSSFIDVEETDEGLVALVGSGGSGWPTGHELWESADGSAWQRSDRSGPPEVTFLASTQGGLVAAPQSPGQLWAEDMGTLGSSYRDHVTGWESAGLVTDVATSGEVTVMTASGDSGQLFVRGTVVEPLEVVPDLPEDATRWRTVGSVAFERDQRIQPHPFQAVSDGAVTMILTPERLFELKDDDGVLVLTPSLVGASNIGVGPGGVWAMIEGSEAQLYVYGSDGVWAADRVPVQGVLSVGEHDGAMAVSGWTHDGSFRMVRRAPGGAWEEVDIAVENGWFAMAPSGILGRREVVEEGRHRSEVLFSADGSEWEVMDGWTLNGLGPGDSFYLVSETDPSTIGMVDELPHVVEVELPGSVFGPIEVERWGDRLIVRGLARLEVQGAGGGWTSLPLDLEHGIHGPAVVVPGPKPRMAIIVGEELRIVEWR